MASNNFHFIRFLAASLVIVGHVYPLNGRQDIIEQWSLGLFPSGHIAVCIFFVISGYCVLHSRIHSPSSFSYLMKRVLRVFPGLLIALVFTAFIVGAFTTDLSFSDYLINGKTYLFFDNLKLYPSTHVTLPGVFEQNIHSGANGSLWTLAYEFTMYIFVVVAVFLFRSKWQWFLLAFCVFFGAFCIYFEFLQGNRILPILHLDLFHLIDFGIYFALGMIFYVYRHLIVLNGRWALAAFGAWMLIYLIADAGYLPLAAIMWVRYFSLSYIVMYLAFIKGPLNHFGDRGDYSYGIYIYAYPIQQMIISFWGNEMSPFQQILLAFTLVLPLAWFSWHIIEKPALKFKLYFK
jgi:peptidoglycan/LPS O-acetylase OafA/YrhL